MKMYLKDEQLIKKIDEEEEQKEMKKLKFKFRNWKC